MNLQQLQQQRQEETREYWNEEAQNTDQRYLTIDTWGIIDEMTAASVLAGYLLALEEVERNISNTQQEHNIARHGDTPDDGYDRAIDVVATLKAQAEALTGKE